MDENKKDTEISEKAESDKKKRFPLFVKVIAWILASIFVLTGAVIGGGYIFINSQLLRSTAFRKHHWASASQTGN